MVYVRDRFHPSRSGSPTTGMLTSEISYTSRDVGLGRTRDNLGPFIMA